MNKCQRPNQEEGNVEQGLHHHEIKQPIAQNGRVDNEQGTPDGGIRDPQRKKQQRQLAQVMLAKKVEVAALARWRS